MIRSPRTGRRAQPGGARRNQSYYYTGNQFIYLSLRQPLELGHKTKHRYHIAQAAYSQYQWNVIQAEFQAMVQTYNLFQTAAYQREKYRIAQELVAFNERLQKSLQRQLAANQVPAADVAFRNCSRPIPTDSSITGSEIVSSGAA